MLFFRDFLSENKTIFQLKIINTTLFGLNPQDCFNMHNKKIGLSLYRLVLAFLLLKSCLFYLPMGNTLFGAAGIYPIEQYERAMNFLNYGFITYDFSAIYNPTIFLLIIIVFGILFLFGELGWISGIVLYTLYTILRMRNPFILDGSDNVIQVTMPFLIMADSYHYFTTGYSKKFKVFNRIVSFTKPLTSIVNPIATYGILIQVTFVYFFTALAKLQGSLWLNGTAVFYTMRVAEFRATDWNIPLTNNYVFVVLATYFTLLWELAFTFLIWFKKTKFWIIGLGIIFHIGIFIFMRIDNFSWIMIGSYALFINDEEYVKISNMFKTMLNKFIKWKDLKTVRT